MSFANFLSAILFISGALISKAQVFQGFTYEELVRPLQEMQKAHDQAATSINQLYGYVTDVLGHDIDAQLRKEMNAELKTLDNLGKQLSGNGISASIRHGIDASYRRIQKSIADYNNRVAKYNEQAAKEEAARRAEAARKAAEPDDWSGTGFALKEGYIVTNYHVIDGAERISVKGVNGNFNSAYSASVVCHDANHDLAIIKITDSRFPGFERIPYQVKTNSSEVGEDVYVLGYPLTATMGDEIKYTTGVISSKTGFQGDISLYQISAPIQPGNSGGPLFDSKGSLIGIVSSKHSGAENVGYAIKTSYLQSLIDSRISSSIIPSTSSVATLRRTEQIKSIQKCVFMIQCSRTPIYSSGAGYSSSASSTYGRSTSKGTSYATGNSGKTYGTITSLNRSEVTLSIGESFQIQINPSNVAIEKYESDNTKVATVSSSGLIRATGTGRTNIWVYGSIGGDLKRCYVTVSEYGSIVNSDASVAKKLSSLSHTKVTLSKGEALQIEAYPKGVQIKKYVSDNPRVATISSSGVIVGVGKGTTNIWVHDIYGELKHCSVKVR